MNYTLLHAFAPFEMPLQLLLIQIQGVLTFSHIHKISFLLHILSGRRLSTAESPHTFSVSVFYYFIWCPGVKCRFKAQENGFTHK